MNKKAAKEKADERQSVNVREPQGWRLQDVDWFVHFWNQQRQQWNARLPKLFWLTDEQVRELKFRQADYGVETVRQMVINAMRSDYLNCRNGKRARNDLDFLLSAKFFPRVAQGRYNDLEVEERALTPEEQRQLELERYRAQQEARRAEVRRIDEEERARREAERDSWALTSCTYEEYQRMLKNGKLKMDN